MKDALGHGSNGRGGDRYGNPIPGAKRGYDLGRGLTSIPVTNEDAANVLSNSSGKSEGVPVHSAMQGAHDEELLKRMGYVYGRQGWGAPR